MNDIMLFMFLVDNFGNRSLFEEDGNAKKSGFFKKHKHMHFEKGLKAYRNS